MVPLKPTNRLQTPKKDHRPNIPQRNPNQKIISGCNLFWYWKTLWQVMAIWHTQRSGPISLPIFIKHFLKDWTFKTQINTFSNPKPQEIGIPQGSILSLVLFLITIYKITTCLPLEINRSLYVENFLICYSSKNMATIERKIQQCITMENGFKISNNKT